VPRSLALNDVTSGDNMNRLKWNVIAFVTLSFLFVATEASALRSWSPSQVSLNQNGLFIENGNLLTFANSSPITAVSIDAATNMVGFSPGDLTFNANNVAVNWPGLSFDGNTKVVLDVTGGLLGSTVTSQYYSFGSAYTGPGSPATFTADGSPHATFGDFYSIIVTDTQIIYDFLPSPSDVVPEPSSYAFLLTGLLCAGAAASAKRRSGFQLNGKRRATAS
jgi:hypothetical protein